MAPEVLTRSPHIEVTPGVNGGKARIAGRRITVQNIAIWHERLGLSVDEISAEHELSIAEIYAALAYYFDHYQEIDAEIEAGDAFVEQLREANSSPLQRKLRSRLAHG